MSLEQKKVPVTTRGVAARRSPMSCIAQRERALCTNRKEAQRKRAHRYAYKRGGTNEHSAKSPQFLGRRRELGDGGRLQVQRPVDCRVATRDSLFCRKLCNSFSCLAHIAEDTRADRGLHEASRCG
jgi:hypothetical protein